MAPLALKCWGGQILSDGHFRPPISCCPHVEVFTRQCKSAAQYYTTALSRGSDPSRIRGLSRTCCCCTQYVFLDEVISYVRWTAAQPLFSGCEPLGSHRNGIKQPRPFFQPSFSLDFGREGTGSLPKPLSCHRTPSLGGGGGKRSQRPSRGSLPKTGHAEPRRR